MKKLTTRRMLTITVTCLVLTIMLIVSASAASPKTQVENYFKINDGQGMVITYNNSVVTVNVPYKTIVFDSSKETINVVEATFSPMGSGSAEKNFSPSDAEYEKILKELNKLVTDLKKRIESNSSCNGIITLELPSYCQYEFNCENQNITLTEATFSPYGSGSKQTIYTTSDEQYTNVFAKLKFYPEFLLKLF